MPVRDEFFVDRQLPATASETYYMDFTYLYDTAQQDFVEFTSGRHVTEADVLAEIGDKASWEHRHTPPQASRDPTEENKAAEQLAACQSWALPAHYLPIE